MKSKFYTAECSKKDSLIQVTTTYGTVFNMTPEQFKTFKRNPQRWIDKNFGTRHVASEQPSLKEQEYQEELDAGQHDNID